MPSPAIIVRRITGDTGVAQIQRLSTGRAKDGHYRVSDIAYP